MVHPNFNNANENENEGEGNIEIPIRVKRIGAAVAPPFPIEIQGVTAQLGPLTQYGNRLLTHEFYEQWPAIKEQIRVQLLEIDPNLILNNQQLAPGPFNEQGLTVWIMPVPIQQQHGGKRRKSRRSKKSKKSRSIRRRK